MMLRTITLLLLVGHMFLVASQSIDHGYTKIITPGSIHSTPGLCGDATDYPLFVKATNDSMASLACPFAEEKMWPSALETLELRNAGSREKMKDYNTWYVADLGNNTILLWVPMAINSHMPENMRDKSDFLIVIPKDAVALGEKVSLLGDDVNQNPDKEPAQGKSSNPLPINLKAKGFADQLKTILGDFGNGFSTIQGEIMAKDSTSFDFGDKYYVKIQLEGAEETYLSEDLFSDDLTYVASYGEFTDSIQAKAKYQSLVDAIDATRMPGFSLIKTDEFVSSVMINQGYLTFDLLDNLSDEYDKMVLQVEVIKTFDFDEEFDLIDKFMVVLRVKTI